MTSLHIQRFGRVAAVEEARGRATVFLGRF